MILNHCAFICEQRNSANVFKMYKKCIFFICVVFVLEVKTDCDGYVECFNNFFTNFFAKTDTNVEYVNATSKNLPENFVEVKNVQFSEINQVLSEISSFIQQDIDNQLKTRSKDVVFQNVNPKTKIYVKTFTYNNSPGNIKLPGLENIEVKEELVSEKSKEKDLMVEQRSSFDLATPTPTVNNYKLNVIENQKDISENEIPNTDDMLSYYDSVEDNSTDYPIIDYVELYKDTTNEENVYNPTEVPLTGDIRDHIQEKIVEYVDNMEKFIEDINNGTEDNSTEVSTVYPWIATIFLKNDSKSNQFEYYCDGALLNERLLITAARCVNMGNSPVDPDSLLVILGKRSLLSMADKEKAVKIKQIIAHENFTNDGEVRNDLALLVIQDPVVFNDVIQPATMGNDTEYVDKYFTTAWNLQGDIVPVVLENKEEPICKGYNIGEHMFCASYGLNVALCPSYGGIFAGYQDDSWKLYGIRTGDTSDRGVCFDKNVAFTDLRHYENWVREHFE